MRRIMVEKKHSHEHKLEAAPAGDAVNNDVQATGVADDDSARESLVPVEVATVPQEEYDRLKAERDQLFDRLARLQAEFDNSRKRDSKDRSDFRDFAVSNAVEQFLPVLDNFQLALKST